MQSFRKFDCHEYIIEQKKSDTDGMISVLSAVHIKFQQFNLF